MVGNAVGKVSWHQWPGSGGGAARTAVGATPLPLRSRALRALDPAHAQFMQPCDAQGTARCGMEPGEADSQKGTGIR